MKSEKSLLTFFLLVAAMALPCASHAQSVQGPNSPDSVTYQAFACLACPGADWNNFNNVKVSDSAYAEAQLASFPQCNTFSCYYSRGLMSTKFGFNVPANATIKGIRADVQRLAGAPNIIRDSAIYLMEYNAVVGMNKADTAWWPVFNTYTGYGDSTDLWGATLTPANVNDPTFGLFFKPFNFGISSGFIAADVDHIQLSVYYTIPTNVSAPAASPFSNINITAETGGDDILISFDVSRPAEFYSVAIFSATGQRVFMKENFNLHTGSHRETINTENFSKGLYIVRITSADACFSKKVLIGSAQ